MICRTLSETLSVICRWVLPTAVTAGEPGLSAEQKYGENIQEVCTGTLYAQ